MSILGLWLNSLCKTLDFWKIDFQHYDRMHCAAYTMTKFQDSSEKNTKKIVTTKGQYFAPDTLESGKSIH